MPNTQTASFTARLVAALSCCLLVAFLIQNYFHYWWGWPALFNSNEQSTWQQWLLIAIIFMTPFFFIHFTPRKSYQQCADGYATSALFIANIAFWSVVYVGLVDVAISWLRVEDALSTLVGTELASNLGRSIFRGTYIHVPCLILAVITASIVRGVHVIWLSLFIVVAEFGIVISRFIFSYEQAFMADLVRFWYAALFLFSSGYTLLHEAHVRVDVLYDNFSSQAKALSNITGIFLFGLPLCWCILIFGLDSKSSSLIAPLLNFEISQSGYGMYVKYLMAGFLLIFAITMILQFMHLFLNSCAALRKPTKTQEAA